MSASALVLALAALAAASPYDQGNSALEDRLLHAPWEDRLRVVRTLASRGPDGRVLLELAARDADWQVRMAAAEALGGAGYDAVPALQRLAGGDGCRLVRLAAAHQLGRLNAEFPPPADDERSACASAYLPNEDAAKVRAVRSKDSTRPDEAGCLYLRFQRLGKNVCPPGMGVRGIGRPPDSPKLLKVRGDDGGVAFCCPGGESLAEPVEVECRIVPEDCPSPWQEMDEGGDAKRGKEGRFRRDVSDAEGDLHWLQCCRPVPTGGSEETAAAPPEPEPAPRRRPRRPAPPPAAPVPQPEPAVDEAPPPEEPGPSPEALIAQRALERLKPPESPPPPPSKRKRETLPRPEAPAAREEAPTTAEPREERPERAAPAEGLEPPVTGDAETLPAPEGISGRDERHVDGDASRESVEKKAPHGSLSGHRALGKRDGDLPAPEAPEAREEKSVRAEPAVMPDAGMMPGKDDPLPVLVEKLAGGSSAVRARAAEMIGALGADGRPAAAALLAALKDKDPRVRSDAALALGSVTAGTDEAVPALKRLLKDKHPDVRYSAVAALGRVGTPAAEKAFAGHMRGMARAVGDAPSK